MSSTTELQTRPTFELRDLIALALIGWLACCGFGVQVTFFRQVAQVGTWLPVSVLIACGLIVLLTFGALLTPFVRRVIRALRLDAQRPSACCVRYREDDDSE